MFRTKDTPDPLFTDTLELDLATVVPSIAGPKRPQDRIALTDAASSWEKVAAQTNAATAKAAVEHDGKSFDLEQGSVVIAAITSCTNTSNPSVLMAAGLLAQKAVAKGLRSKPWVKTSLAPGSRVVTDYLEKSGLLGDLETLGFNVVGYGCTTCIGNSGPLDPAIAHAITEADLTVASVLSGNRNFEGRISPHVRANYLASPPLVVAYALAGHMGVDLYKQPLGQDQAGKDVFLQDVWPSPREVQDVVRKTIGREMFEHQYASVFEGDANWKRLETPSGQLYAWDDSSTYVRNPPYFEGMTPDPSPLQDIVDARVLAKLGDSVTTDHISPAGSIPKDGPAGKYLIANGVQPIDFNSFGSRRGNHEVMIRGTFANIRLKNQLAPGTEGGVTRHQPSDEPMSIFDASERYREEGVPLVVLAGSEYGTGSSRDWAAKGTILLGVRAVIVKSFERIHRSNLVGMGVLPLQFKDGEDADQLCLSGREQFTITGIADGLRPGKLLDVIAKDSSGKTTQFQAVCRIDTPNEVEYYRHGGILQYVLRNMLRGGKA